MSVLQLQNFLSEFWYVKSIFLSTHPTVTLYTQGKVKEASITTQFWQLLNVRCITCACVYRNILKNLYTPPQNS